MISKREFIDKIEEIVRLIDVPYECDDMGRAKDVKDAVEFARNVSQDDGDVIVAAGLVGFVALCLAWGEIRTLDAVFYPIKLMMIGDKQEKRVKAYLDAEKRSN